MQFLSKKERLLDERISHKKGGNVRFLFRAKKNNHYTQKETEKNPFPR